MTDYLRQEVRGDIDLYKLLNSALQIDPERRIEISSILRDGFVNKVLTNSSSIESNANNIKVFKKYVEFQSRITYTRRLEFEVSSSDVGTETLDKFMVMTSDDLLKLFKVEFRGEQGYDCAALTTSLYNRVLKSCIGVLLVPLSKKCNSEVFIPVPNADDQYICEQFKSLGKLLAKVLFDQRTIPVTLASYIWRFLLKEHINTDNLSQLVSIRDVDTLDSQYSNSLWELTIMSDVSGLFLDFSDVDNGNNTPLTNDNVPLYIQKSIEHKLITSRLKNLQALRDGFRCIPDFLPCLNQLNEMDVAVLIYEQQFIDVEILISCLSFVVPDSTNEMKEMFISILRSFTQEELKKTLYFVTGQVGLFRSGDNDPLMNPNKHEHLYFPRNKITINFLSHLATERFPVARVCQYCLDMPLYSNMEQMRTKLISAINLIDESFDLN
jgi:hypothetical protein